MKSILIEEAYRAIKVRDGTREVTITVIRAVVRSMALAAVKGRRDRSACSLRCCRLRKRRRA
jgi:hypothetical protein